MAQSLLTEVELEDRDRDRVRISVGRSPIRVGGRRVVSPLAVALSGRPVSPERSFSSELVERALRGRGGG